MKELNDEIKLTINTMQCDIDDGAHGELQSHLYSLLEIKRNELQQRLVERSWVGPVSGTIETVTHDQESYKGVKLNGQVADETKPLTTEELKAGGWWCADASEECRLAFAASGTCVMSHSWNDGQRVQCVYKPNSESFVIRAHLPTDLDSLKQIHRIGNEFYWGEK